MPKKSDVIRLRHMFDASTKAVEFVRGKDRASLDQDEKLALALVRLIEIIGEAAAKVSPEVQIKNSQIPWKEIVGTRNRLIHGYEDVDLDVVWQIATVDLLSLTDQLRSALVNQTGTDQEQLWK
jgi:uncharacterized protein with HEPN domain